MFKKLSNQHVEASTQTESIGLSEESNDEYRTVNNAELTAQLPADMTNFQDNSHNYIFIPQTDRYPSKTHRSKPRNDFWCEVNRVRQKVH